MKERSIHLGAPVAEVTSRSHRLSLGLSIGGLTITSGNISSGNVMGVGTPSGAGSIFVNNTITSGGSVALVSNADCGLAGNSGEGVLLLTVLITIIAGAAFGTPTSGILNITGASTTGGQISLGSLNVDVVISLATSSGNTTGGDIT